MMKEQRGFTLIELIIVIVILGLLAALAIPKYIAVQQQARTASINGLAGGLRGAVALARAQYMVAGNMAATTVTMDGTAVACAAGTGIPTGTAAGIGAAMQDLTGFTGTYTTPTAVTFQFTSNPSATCEAVYNGTTGIVTTVITGC